MIKKYGLNIIIIIRGDTMTMKLSFLIKILIRA